MAKAKAKQEAEERNDRTNDEDERSGGASTVRSGIMSRTAGSNNASTMEQERARLEQEIDQLQDQFKQKSDRLKKARARSKQENARLKQWNQTGNTKCRHSPDTFEFLLFDFTSAFNVAFCEARDRDTSLSRCLIAAEYVTQDEFADVWYDSAKMESAISYLLFYGTQDILDGDYNHARENATFARYFEQHMAFQLKQTQAIFRWNKIHEAQKSDQHTLVKFFQRRIPCSCLDDTYEEVKSITKLGLCFNPRCNCPDRLVKHSKTMYCDRCRSVTYCSRKCQKADWSRHKTNCEKEAERIAEFEASKKQS